MAGRKSSISDEVLNYIHNNGVDQRERIIYSHSFFSEEGWELDYRQANIFVKNLDFLNSINSSTIKVRAMSPGGCYYSGFMIYDAIRTSVAPVDYYCYGLAASMGSIIPQAARKRYISQNACFMVHRISSYDEGDILRLKSGIDFTKKQMDKMFLLYAERCVDGKFFKNKKMTVGEVAAFIEEKLQKTGDWWMSPEETVNYGFMDEII